MKMKTKKSPTKALALAIAVVGGTTTFIGESDAATYRWSYATGIFNAVGHFSTPVTSGTIDETQVTAHSYTVSIKDVPQYKVDLVAGTFTAYDGGPSGVYAVYHDFQYVLGNSRFERKNLDVYDPEFPVDFSVETATSDSGLPLTGFFFDEGYFVSEPSWVLLRDGYGPATKGFDSGPVVSLVPVPMALPLFATALAGLGGIAWRKRRTV